MRIFAEVPWREGVKRQWGCRQLQFSAFSLVISGKFRDKATVIIQAIGSPSSAFQ